MSLMTNLLLKLIQKRIVDRMNKDMGQQQSGCRHEQEQGKAHSIYEQYVKDL